MLYGALTVRMYRGSEFQLTTFSVPSNSAAKSTVNLIHVNERRAPLH